MKKANEFIEIDGKTYFVYRVHDNDLLESVIGADVSGHGTWYSCLDSRGHRVTVFDPCNSGKYAVVDWKWICEDSVYNSAYDIARNWLHDNIFTRLAEHVKNAYIRSWAKRNGYL